MDRRIPPGTETTPPAGESIRREPDPPFYDEAPPQQPGSGDGDSGQPQQPAGDTVPDDDAVRSHKA